MSKLRAQQHQFAMMIAHLLDFIEAYGFEVTLGDAYRDPRATFPYGHPNSYHRRRLAQDLNLFRDGIYLVTVKDYLPVGEEWERLGGTWGGRWSPPDVPHFSLGEGR